jgi:hypothetical protein
MASVALGAAGAHHPPLPHADKITGFSHWLGGVLDDVVMGRDGSWMAPFAEAGELGRRRAAVSVGADSAPTLESSTEFLILQPDGHRHYNSLAVSELRGIFAPGAAASRAGISAGALCGLRGQWSENGVSSRRRHFGTVSYTTRFALVVEPIFQAGFIHSLRTGWIQARPTSHSGWWARIPYELSTLATRETSSRFMHGRITPISNAKPQQENQEVVR